MGIRGYPSFFAQGRTGKFVAIATCAPRSEQGEEHPCSIVQGRIRILVAVATCAPRGE